MLERERVHNICNFHNCNSDGAFSMHVTLEGKENTRSSWLNCTLRDDEAVYWVSIGHYEALAVGNCDTGSVGGITEAQKPGWQGGIATRIVFARPESFCV